MTASKLEESIEAIVGTIYSHFTDGEHKKDGLRRTLRAFAEAVRDVPMKCCCGMTLRWPLEQERHKCPTHNPPEPKTAVAEDNEWFMNKVKGPSVCSHLTCVGNTHCIAKTEPKECDLCDQPWNAHGKSLCQRKPPKQGECQHPHCVEYGKCCHNLLDALPDQVKEKIAHIVAPYTHGADMVQKECEELARLCLSLRKP